ncbi:hypothetical protein K239x_17750 [Planctomycetes bacterium K23_9]|uniref:Uncharacterized protein n=1 Tax=Stieleria marina TaxID=1930275 RepID=A0A517NRQ5_9BACT|nr:hypothetical protein K239x_17750 [Planctomycetes bacterium K23_9]
MDELDRSKIYRGRRCSVGLRGVCTQMLAKVFDSVFLPRVGLVFPAGKLDQTLSFLSMSARVYLYPPQSPTY